MTQHRCAWMLLAAAAEAAHASPPNPHFRSLGDLAGGAFVSRAFDVEYHPFGSLGPPGITVVGESEGEQGRRAFRWTLRSGMSDLGVLEPGHTFSTAAAVSYWDGTVVVGTSGLSETDTQAFYWHSGQGMLPVGDGTVRAAYGLVEDVAVLCVGRAESPTGMHAVKATNFPSMSILPSLGGAPEDSAALDSSWNGGFTVGYSRDSAGLIQAVRWSPAHSIVGLGFLNTSGDQESRARAIATQGVTIVGESTSPRGPMEAFRTFILSGPITGLGDLPGGEFRSSALAVNSGGTPLTIVGWSEAADGERAFIWTETDGMRDLNMVLADAGYNTAGWKLQRATGISARAKAIVGYGVNPSGFTEGWLAYLSCYHDCNGDLQKTVADFACFQSRFALSDLYADCDESGALTIADFACFQSAFVSALPEHCNE